LSRPAKAPDKYTVTFRLKEPSAIFLATVPEILVVKSKLAKKNEKDGDWGQAWLAKKVASTGSHKLKRYDLAIGFVGERFKEHFAGWGDKAFDEIEFRAVLETNTRVQGPIKGAHRHHPAVSSSWCCAALRKRRLVLVVCCNVGGTWRRET
jgi:peptide/nickel transport system substrate-binding protein